VSVPDIDRVVTATARSSPQETTGAHHPNAVAVRGDPRVGFTIVAIAAGHGRRTATRSDIGARIAVDVAATRAEAAVAANGVPDAHALAEVGDVLATRVIEQWQAQVHHHVAARPFAGDELERVDGGRDDDSADPLPAYDATLLLTIVTPQAVLALQIGSGDIVVQGIAGDTLQPVGGAATSGDDPGAPGLAGAPADAQHAVVDRASGDVAMVLLATEGLAKALDGPAAITSLASELAGEAQAHGVDRVEAQLPRRLAELARAGRDDGRDVTVTLVFPAAYLPAAQVPRAVPPSLATIVNPAVPVAGAATAAGAAATSAEPAAGVGSSGGGRRRLLGGTALIAGTVLLAVGLAFALSHEGGTPAPASPVPPTPTTKHPPTSVATTVTTVSPVSATTFPASTTPSTVPPTAAPIVVTTPTTAKPAKKKTTTTSTTRPKATTTTTTTTTTMPVTSST